MANFNFADFYKSEGLTPGPDIMGRRQETFDKLRNKISASLAVDLTRLYFGLPTPKGTDWFRDAFAETDPSFSMIDNAREASVLSACLLASAINDGKPFAGLAVLTAAVAGNRTPLVRPTLPEEARQALHNQALQRRHFTNTISSAPTPNTPQAATPTQASRQSRAATREFKTQLSEVQEEVDMLWWYVGGWSLMLERPFSELSKPLSAVTAGLDLASLTKKPLGPAAAPALLQRLISGTPNKEVGKTSLQDAVDALPRELFANLKLGSGPKQAPDICPVLAALSKAAEIGASPAWQEAFKATAHIEPDTTLHPFELAMQVYRERLLSKLL